MRSSPGSDGLGPLLLQHAVLSGRVSPQGSLSASFTGIQAVLQIAHDIAGGMGYLHDRGVLHGVSGVCRGAHVLPPGRTAVGLSMRHLRGRFTCTVAACCLGQWGVQGCWGWLPSSISCQSRADTALCTCSCPRGHWSCP